MPPTDPGPRPVLAPWRQLIGSTSRWALRLGLLVALLASAVEGGSYLVYRVVAGRWFSFARATRQRQRLRASPDVCGGDVVVSPRGELIPINMHRYAVVHPYLGFCYGPEYRPRRLRWEAPPTNWGFTDWGYRSPVRKRGPGKVVIGILGASVASQFAGYGLGVLERELRQSPRFSGLEIEFVSLAVGGFKQPQQLMALNYALSLGAEFDLILNLDGLNEVAWYRHDGWVVDTAHLYPNGWHRFVAQLPDPATSTLIAKKAWLSECRSRWARPFQASRLRCTVTANLIWKLGDLRAARRETVATKALVRKMCREPRRAAFGPHNHFRNDGDVLARLVANWERGSLLIDRLCKAHGIAYHHFLQPNQYVPGSKPLNVQEKKVAILEDLPGRHWIEKGYLLLRQAGQRLAKQGVHFHDLSMAYVGNENTLYIDNCCHINPAGAEALAEPMAQTLLQTDEPTLARASHPTADMGSPERPSPIIDGHHVQGTGS